MGAVPEMLPPHKMSCPRCGKHYVVAEWKQSPKCRQCNIELRAGAYPDKVPAKAQTA
jgi:ribosomal protein L37AE/L43A